MWKARIEVESLPEPCSPGAPGDQAISRGRRRGSVLLVLGDCFRQAFFGTQTCPFDGRALPPTSGIRRSARAVDPSTPRRRAFLEITPVNQLPSLRRSEP